MLHDVLIFIARLTNSLTQLNMETSSASWWSDLIWTSLTWCSCGRTQNTRHRQVFSPLIDEVLWIFSVYAPQSSVCPNFTSAGIWLLQDWLTESARLISKSGHTVEWVTPLGLPIIQPYHRTRNQVVRPKSICIRAWGIFKSGKSDLIFSFCVFCVISTPPTDIFKVLKVYICWFTWVQTATVLVNFSVDPLTNNRNPFVTYLKPIISEVENCFGFISFTIIILSHCNSTHYISLDFDGISDEADNKSRWLVSRGHAVG